MVSNIPNINNFAHSYVSNINNFQIQRIDKTSRGTTTLSLSGPESNANEVDILYSSELQNWGLTS